MERVRMKRCNGDSCQQGRLPCQTPQACEVEEEDYDAGFDWTGLFIAAIAIFCVFGMVWTLAK